MTDNDFDKFDFIINEDDEVMLLLYARETIPQNPCITIDFEDKSAMLQRNSSDGIQLKEIPDEILDSLQETDKLLVCELNTTNDEKDTQIVYAYEAEIND